MENETNTIVETVEETEEMTELTVIETESIIDSEIATESEEVTEASETEPESIIESEATTEAEETTEATEASETEPESILEETTTEVETEETTETECATQSESESETGESDGRGTESSDNNATIDGEYYQGYLESIETLMQEHNDLIQEQTNVINNGFNMLAVIILGIYVCKSVKWSVQKATKKEVPYMPMKREGKK
ncbi:MAG: hypothetical protein IJ326_05410 [Lachnospiraceae bacterium]|nr:hypothetical protein [Lachnospiraceae bacterium]